MAFELVQPHNFNIPNPHNFYMILRTFATPERRPGWIECGGIYKTASKAEFDSVVDPKTI